MIQSNSTGKTNIMKLLHKNFEFSRAVDSNSNTESTFKKNTRHLPLNTFSLKIILTTENMGYQETVCT